MVSLGQFQPSATRAFLEYILAEKATLQRMATGTAETEDQPESAD